MSVTPPSNMLESTLDNITHNKTSLRAATSGTPPSGDTDKEKSTPKTSSDKFTVLLQGFNQDKAYLNIAGGIVSESAEIDPSPNDQTSPDMLKEVEEENILFSLQGQMAPATLTTSKLEKQNNSIIFNKPIDSAPHTPTNKAYLTSTEEINPALIANNEVKAPTRNAQEIQGKIIPTTQTTMRENKPVKATLGEDVAPALNLTATADGDTKSIKSTNLFPTPISDEHISGTKTPPANTPTALKQANNDDFSLQDKMVTGTKPDIAMALKAATQAIESFSPEDQNYTALQQTLGPTQVSNNGIGTATAGNAVTAHGTLMPASNMMNSVPAPPIFTSTMPFSLENPGWEANITNFISGHIEDGGTLVELTLTPENLGKLEVRIEIRDGSTEVRFLTENRDAARLISQAESRLADLFNRQGMNFAGQDTQHQNSGNAPQERQNTQDQRIATDANVKNIGANEISRSTSIEKNQVNLIA